MKRKIAFLFCVIIIVFCKENYAKYIVEQTILIAEINIDTIFPEIELISITETPEKEQYKVNFQIKVVENNIKIIDYLEEEKFENIPTKKLFSRILKEKMSGKNAGEIGLNFHYTLIKAIEKIAEKNNVKELAFSGGVWQNALLVDLAIDVLGEKFLLHFHEKLSPNDENISFGQLNYYLNYLKFEV